jgi:hypothetical protein
LSLKLKGVISDAQKITPDKLRAIDMTTKYYQMFGANNVLAVQLNIQNVLD